MVQEQYDLYIELSRIAPVAESKVHGPKGHIYDR